MTSNLFAIFIPPTRLKWHTAHVGIKQVIYYIPEIHPHEKGKQQQQKSSGLLPAEPKGNVSHHIETVSINTPGSYSSRAYIYITLYVYVYKNITKTTLSFWKRVEMERERIPRGNAVRDMVKNKSLICRLDQGDSSCGVERRQKSRGNVCLWRAAGAIHHGSIMHLKERWHYHDCIYWRNLSDYLRRRTKDFNCTRKFVGPIVVRLGRIFFSKNLFDACV